MKPDVCIYHAGCQDGFAAAWAVWRAYKDIEFIAHSYGQPAPDVAGKHVLIVDYSFKYPVLVEMGRSAKSITILDHHKSAEADLAPFKVARMEDLKDPEELHVHHFTLSGVPVQAYFDMESSGAMLAWMYVNGPCSQPPSLIYHVQDRDLWRFKLDGTREIHSVLSAYDFNFVTWDNIAASLEDPEMRDEVVADGDLLQRAHMKSLRELLEATQRTMVIGGFEVPVANMPYSMASEAGNILSQGRPFAATYFDKNDGTRSFSLRSSDGGEDVSKIASSYGGGGHAKAAGFSMPLGWEGDRFKVSMGE
jgi:oligoribonuclease NrnB/cAMP/cGMP phosphodiesterase (DHH superfamily)